METKLKNLQQLKEELDRLNPSDNLAYIRFYEKNVDSIEKIDSTNDQGLYNTKLKLLSEYGLSLVGAGHYTRGASVLEKAIPLFEDAHNQDSGKLREIPYFEHLLWCYGVAMWETKQVKRAVDVFNRLIDYYPDNDKYRSWLNGIKATRIRKYTNPLWIVMAVLLVGNFTIFEKFNPTTQFLLSLLGAALLVSVGVLELFIYFIKKGKAGRLDTQHP